MVSNLIAGIIGIAALGIFCGIMVWWVQAVPLMIIFAFVFALLIYDFVQTLRHGEDY